MSVCEYVIDTSSSVSLFRICWLTPALNKHSDNSRLIALSPYPSDSPSSGSDIPSFSMLSLEENEQDLTKEDFKKYFSVALSKSHQTRSEYQEGFPGTLKKKNLPGEVY
jgi:hypothetical protein